MAILTKGIKVHNLNTSTRSSTKEIIIDMEASWISGYGLDCGILI